jgi:hypothetical protein
MAKHVCNLAMFEVLDGACSGHVYGHARKMVNTSYQPAANIMDHIPMKNIMPFGMCKSPANPTVAAATASAMGVLTPMPCIPNTPAPWMPGAPTVLLNNFPALDDTSKVMCIWAGVIEVSNPGQQAEDIP